MNTERPSLSLLLLFIPAIISSVISGGNYITAIPSLILVIYSYFNKFNFPRNSFNSTLACLMIVGVSLLIHSFVITDLPTGNGPHIMAASMIVLNVYLWYYGNPKLTTGIISLLCLLIMIFTGNNMNDEHNTYYLIIYLFIPCGLTYLFSLNNYISKKNIIVLLISIITIIFSSNLLNKLLFFADDKLNLFLQKMISSDETYNSQNFSDPVILQNEANLKLSKKPVILLKAKNIQYLRAEILENYSRKSWNTIQKSSKEPFKFNYQNKALMSYNKLSNNHELLNNSQLGKIEFIEKTKNISLPINTIAYHQGDYKVKPYNTLVSQNYIDSLDFYTVNRRDFYYKPESNETDIEKTISDSIRALSVNLSSKNTDNLSKAQSIQNYFSNYKYSLDISFAQDKDPVIDFIFNNKSGFCLHFASAMTLMLRSINIPAHIVTGYTVTEYSDFFKAYIIRERDAHAWVEVFDNKTGSWKTFDPTPANQMEQYMKDDPEITDNLSLYLKSLWLNIKGYFSIFSLENITNFGRSPYTIFVLFIATIYIVFRNYSFNKKELLSKETQKFLNSLDKKIKLYKIDFKDNMTYSELIENIIQNQSINHLEKENIVLFINEYQNRKYLN